MTEPDAMFLHQVLFCSSCTLEIHPLKRQFQTILITNSWKTKNTILFGKPIQEEDQSIILANSSKIFSLEWWLLIQPNDPKFNKSQLIHGLRVRSALTVKSRKNFLWDRRNWMLFWTRGESNKRCKNSKTWPLQLQEVKLVTEVTVKIRKTKLLKISEQNFT